MEVLYITSVPSYQEFYRMKTQIRDNVNVTTYGMNESGFKFHSLILEGMCSHDVNIYHLVGRSIAYKTHRGIWWKKRIERVNDRLVYEHVACTGLPVVKQFLMAIAMYFKVNKWLRKNKGKECNIVMDASYVTVLPAVVKANRGRATTTAIYCDLYDYMADVKDARENEKVSLIKRMLRKLVSAAYNELDSYIFLTEAMNKVINKKNKPYIVMEGLVDQNMNEVVNDLQKKADGHVVMYAGALREPYGLKNLIEGFSAYEDEKARLWIFGDGDYREEVRKVQKLDSRIIYFGVCPISEVIEKEIQATLLVNPRPADMEFAKYSFPSKNMEYMVSGTPVLTTRLPGMPFDYYPYVITIDGETPEDITTSLQKAFSNTEEELHMLGEKAKKFVLSNKNNKEQAGRILALLSDARKRV